MPCRRKHPARLPKRPTPPIPVTIAGVTYRPKVRPVEYTPREREIRLH